MSVSPQESDFFTLAMDENVRPMRPEPRYPGWPLWRPMCLSCGQLLSKDSPRCLQFRAGSNSRCQLPCWSTMCMLKHLKIHIVCLKKGGDPKLMVYHSWISSLLMSFEYNNIKYIKLSFRANLMSKIKNAFSGRKHMPSMSHILLEIRDLTGGTVAPVISVVFFGWFIKSSYMVIIWIILTLYEAISYKWNNPITLIIPCGC